MVVKDEIIKGFLQKNIVSFISKRHLYTISTSVKIIFWGMIIASYLHHIKGMFHYTFFFHTYFFQTLINIDAFSFKGLLHNPYAMNTNKPCQPKTNVHII